MAPDAPGCPARVLGGGPLPRRKVSRCPALEKLIPPFALGREVRRAAGRDLPPPAIVAEVGDRPNLLFLDNTCGYWYCFFSRLIV